jgi:hypothetical protein
MNESAGSSTTDETDQTSEYGFARVQLPPIPSLGLPAMRLPSPSPAPATDHDGRSVGGRDEPTGTWTSPLPAPAVPARMGYTFQVVPPPVQETATAVMPAPVPATEPAPTAAPSVMPELEQPPAAVATAAASTVVATILLVTAVVLVWASHMAFSAALLAMSALLLAELSRAASLSRAGEARPASATMLAIASIGAAGWSLLKAFGQFGEYAFVGGLFVLLAAIPTLIVFGVTWWMLRRRSDRAAGDQTLMSGTRWRTLALAAMIVSGIQAQRTFTAKPDAIVAIAVAAFAVSIAVAVMRGTDRPSSTS